MFCPECNVCFGREKNPKMREYYYCWVCSRQHHAACVGQERFICAACQNKTLSKRVGVMGGMSSASGMHHLSTHQQSGYQETPRPRLGRPRTNINYANFAWSSFVCLFALLQGSFYDSPGLESLNSISVSVLCVIIDEYESINRARTINICPIITNLCYLRCHSFSLLTLLPLIATQRIISPITDALDRCEVWVKDSTKNNFKIMR